MVAHFCGPSERRDLLEIGAGMGGNLCLGSGFRSVTALDPSLVSCDYLRGLSPPVTVLQESWPRMDTSLESRFDVIFLLDVLEHLDDDMESLGSIYHSLRKDGDLLLTVPAYQWMWSTHDERLHHKRRYVKREIIGKLRRAGFDIVFNSYFTTLLLPFAIVQRFMMKFGLRSKISPPKGKTNSFRFKSLHQLIASFLAVERFIVRTIGLPFGLSIVVIARKSGHSQNSLS